MFPNPTPLLLSFSCFLCHSLPLLAKQFVDIYNTCLALWAVLKHSSNPSSEMPWHHSAPSWPQAVEPICLKDASNYIHIDLGSTSLQPAAADVCLSVCLLQSQFILIDLCLGLRSN